MCLHVSEGGKGRGRERERKIQRRRHIDTQRNSPQFTPSAPPPPSPLAKTLLEYSRPLRYAARITNEVYVVNVRDPARIAWRASWGPWVFEMVWEAPPLYYRR